MPAKPLLFLLLPLLAGAQQWSLRNAAKATPGSYCYDNRPDNCRRYGRLYTWEAARRVCPATGKGWRLPSDAEWRQLAARHGGISADALDKGKSAYKALLTGGGSGFNALLGGGRDQQGQYARGDAHGFYWTATESDGGAVYYNFGKGGQALHRQTGGETQRAFSVRCVRE